MAANTPTTLASRLKQRYNKEVSDIVPAVSDLQRRLEFRQDLESGASTEFDIQLSHEAGFSVGTGAVALGGSIAQVAARASVTGTSMILQTQVSYDLISRANKSEKGFARFADGKFLNMVAAFRNREEWLAINGRRGCGIVTSNTSGALLLTEGSFCPAFWSAQIGAIFEAWTSVTGGSQHNGDLTVSAVDVATRTVTVTGTSAAVVTDDILIPKGQHIAGRIGLMDIAYNTGTQYGINAATYPLWKANAYDCGTSAITLGKILAASGMSANKGCSGETLVCYVPPLSFQGLVADESSLVRYGAGKKKAETGFETISVMGASGIIEIVPHLYMKQGEAVLWAPNYSYILGSIEATSQLAKDGDIFFDLESVAAKEMRMYSDTCGVFTERPGYMTYIARSDSLALHS
jgi:hypothetical protein